MDITMCNGEGCQKKECCYRHTAKPCKYRQSYFVKPPCTEAGSCAYFWDNNGYKEKQNETI